MDAAPASSYDPDDEMVRLCAYCGVKRAVTQDHVVPRSLRRRTLCQWMQKFGECPCPVKHRAIPLYLLVTVPACFDCNNRKGTRRLVPPSWADRLGALNDLLPGKPWRVWDGSPLSPAYRNVHV